MVNVNKVMNFELSLDENNKFCIPYPIPTIGWSHLWLCHGRQNIVCGLSARVTSCSAFSLFSALNGGVERCTTRWGWRTDGHATNTSRAQVNNQ